MGKQLVNCMISLQGEVCCHRTRLTLYTFYCSKPTQWAFMYMCATGINLKTVSHDIAEILLKVALNTKNKNQSNPLVHWICNTKHQFIYKLQWKTVNTSNGKILDRIAMITVLVVEEAEVPRENHRPWASNWQTLSLAAASRVHPQ
jgi:hypothetical protein